MIISTLYNKTRNLNFLYVCIKINIHFIYGIFYAYTSILDSMDISHVFIFFILRILFSYVLCGVFVVCCIYCIYCIKTFWNIWLYISIYYKNLVVYMLLIIIERLFFFCCVVIILPLDK